MSFVHQTVVSKSKSAHMCWGLSGKHKSRYCYRERRRRRSQMFPCDPFDISRPRTILMHFIERDSPRDQLVVTLFLLTVFGLLLGAGIKNRMQKAGISGGLPWNRTSRERWWEVSYSLDNVHPQTKLRLIHNHQPWIPRRQGEEEAPLGLSRFGLSAVHPSVDRSDYAPVSNDRS